MKVLRTTLQAELVESVEMDHDGASYWWTRQALNRPARSAICALLLRLAQRVPPRVPTASGVSRSGGGLAGPSRDCGSGAQHRLRHCEKVAGLAVGPAVEPAPDQWPALQGSRAY